MRRLFLVVAIATMSSLALAQNAQQTPAQQRADAAQRVVTVLTAQYASGTATLDDLATWYTRWFQAKRDTGLTGAPLIAVAQQWVDKMKVLEQLAAMRVRNGAASSAEVDKAMFYRLEAEIALAKLRTP